MVTAVLSPFSQPQRGLVKVTCFTAIMFQPILGLPPPPSISSSALGYLASVYLQNLKIYSSPISVDEDLRSTHGATLAAKLVLCTMLN